MNLLELMGLDPEDFVWQDLGMCSGIERPDTFFDDYESDKVFAEQVDEICLSCPVISTCYEAALSNKERGVWGAVYWNGAGKPDRNFNSHKSPATWDRIRKAVE